MSDLLAYTIHTYQRMYGQYRKSTDVEFMTSSEFINSEIARNTAMVNKYAEEHGHLTNEFLDTCIKTGNDPIFPKIRTNGGFKVFTDQEVAEAKEAISNHTKMLDEVVDLKGIVTTADAEFDRAMIYDYIKKCKQTIEVHENYLEDQKKYGPMIDKILAKANK